MINNNIPIPRITKTIVLSPSSLPIIAKAKVTAATGVSNKSALPILHIAPFKPQPQPQPQTQPQPQATVTVQPKPVMIVPQAPVQTPKEPEPTPSFSTTLATATITATPTKTLGGGTGHIVKGKRFNSTSKSAIKHLNILLEHNYANRFFVLARIN